MNGTMGLAGGRRKRAFWPLLVLAILGLVACGGSDGGDGSDASGTDGSTDSATVEMTTFANVDSSSPVDLPGDIPLPSDAVFVGENAAAAPFRALQFESSIAIDEVHNAVRSFADSEPGARYDEAIAQAQFERDIDGVRHTIYLWPRSLDSTTLEIGIIENPG